MGGCFRTEYTKETLVNFAKKTSELTKSKYETVSQRFKEEPAGEVFLDEATKLASKSAEYGAKVVASAKESMTKFKENGGFEHMQNNATNTATNVGSSFWNYL